MNTLTDCPLPLLMRDLMFEALRVKNERLTALVTELFVRSGAAPVRRLVLEACDRKQPPGYRLRVLHVIARLGVVTDPSSFMDLAVLARMDRNAEVRRAAAQIVSAPRPDAHTASPGPV